MYWMAIKAKFYFPQLKVPFIYFVINVLPIICNSGALIFRAIIIVTGGIERIVLISGILNNGICNNHGIHQLR